jgi:hypothetical protein
MSAYNDYMVSLVNYFVGLSEHYCIMLSQGFDNCIVRNRMNLLAMYIDTIPRTGNEDCLSTEELMAIVEHISWLTGCITWGGLTNINPLSPPAIVNPDPINATAVPQAWNTYIGTAPTVISFSNPLGANGEGWGMTYTAVNSLLETVFITISARTASGFTVVALEDNVHFEGTAILKTS